MFFRFFSDTQQRPIAFNGEPVSVLLGKGYGTGAGRYAKPYLSNDYDGNLGDYSYSYADNLTLTTPVAWGDDTSKYLAGRVHVAVFFVPEEGITFPEDKKKNFTSGLNSALDFIKAVSPASANLNFSVSYREAKTFNESGVFECKCYNKPAWCANWEDYILASLGYSDLDGDGKTSDDVARNVREGNNADNSILIYYVYITRWVSTCPVAVAYAYNIPGSVFIYVSKTNYTITHEILHAFGALDEYGSACSENDCKTYYTPWHYKNGNCISCNPQAVDCIMYDDLPNICQYTAGQIGWGDRDDDGLIDPLDDDMFVPVCRSSTTITTSTASSTSTTLPSCSSTSSMNLSAGDNAVMFQTPHNYYGYMDCFSGVYTCPLNYLARVYLRYDTEQNYDYLYLFDASTGTYKLFSGSSNVFFWFTSNLSSIRLRFVSDGSVSAWGVEVNKINCYPSSWRKEGDADSDGDVDYGDLLILAASYGKNQGDAGYDSRADFNSDGTISYYDLLLLASGYGK